MEWVQTSLKALAIYGRIYHYVEWVEIGAILIVNQYTIIHGRPRESQAVTLSDLGQILKGVIKKRI